ncbi:class I SAM-dependent methyltransferase [Frankia sp. R82]|uniref:class I SAM-dependent methyltransferase n=1 Tax=Frankia sp. R82 TaxID=2950553 RepID=UPI0020441E13|nr:class I SAM-dependent methyltransferase [Frankia sp. R82]MCM3887509.1 class I SAM-dependent methyltransferase [Frankia sp. R82]
MTAPVVPTAHTAGVASAGVAGGVPAELLYELALRVPAARLWARSPEGRRPVPVDLWRGDPVPGDEVLLDTCRGPTLDVGCGPGRLAAALTRRGVRALGIDVTEAAVTLARRAGARALCLDVFGPVPDMGRWQEVILADGNIGIGGDPGRLLRRAQALLAGDGRILAEVDGPGRPTRTYPARLEVAGLTSAPFRWAAVGVDGIGPLGASAGLRVTVVTARAGRYFAVLEPRAGA